MADLLILTRGGRLAMLRHLALDHGVEGALHRVDTGELLVLWWLHGHDGTEKEVPSD